MISLLIVKALIRIILFGRMILMSNFKWKIGRERKARGGASSPRVISPGKLNIIPMLMKKICCGT